MLYFLVFLSGIASGFLNVVGGGGSLITLPLLTLLGMDLSIANGTNRIAILMQNITAVRSFYKDKVLPVKLSLLCAIPATIGSIAGTYVVVNIPQTLLKKIVGVLLLVMAFFIIAKPSMWSGQKKERLNVALIVLAFFGIGFYGGFIQAGVGFFFVFFTAVLLGLDLVKNNALKVFIVLLYTPFSLLIFLLNGKVQPLAGVILGAGSMIGAQLGAKFAVKKGVNWLRYILLATVVASGVSYLI
ncbi:integrase [Pseudothermotoga hypogea DSM 11164 = NBRC 106472]|uniref:Probable membrane transporter protein n=2 Tax=Pseudothermotoga TaxID=1643951 RepID=A0A0X1KSZ5_9THEM|nr:sulfite exporter TauE/SafE family protein [Pseudothermotoga hypogea]AJC74447.1 integrase [Pseudothermotoga hypogea DSM 11164 = NBRC 106472]